MNGDAVVSGKSKYDVFAVALIVAGFVTRIIVILRAGSWWFDESASYSFAKLPILQSWQYLKYENNPPLYYWLLHGWGLLFSFRELSLRSLSFIFGVFTMFAIIRLGRELFNTRTGLWAGAIYAMASFSIFFDTEARMYSLLGFLIVLSYLYFIRIFLKTPTRLDIVWYILFTTFALYTNITGLWVPLTQGIMLLFMKPKTMQRLSALACVIAPVVLFSPWLIAFALERLAFSKYIPAGNWWYFGNAVPWLTLLYEPSTFFNFWNGGSDSIVAAISLLVSSVSIIWFLCYWWKHRKISGGTLTIVAFGLMVPLLFAAVLAPPYNLSSTRYFYQSAIFFWIMLAYGFAKILEITRSKIISIGLMVAVIVYSFTGLGFSIQNSLHGNWDAAAQWIDAQHASMVLAMPKMWAAEVYRPTTPFYFLSPPVAALDNPQPLKPLQLVARYNYNWGSMDYQLASGEETILHNEIGNAIGTSSKIIFGYEGGVTQENMIADLRALGFHDVSNFQIQGYDLQAIAVFSR